MRTTATKAHAAGLGGGLGPAVAFLLAGLVWEAPTTEQLTALSVILTAVLGWAGTYFAPGNRSKA